MKNESKNKALILVSTPEWAVAKDEVKHLQDAAVEQLAAISKMENAAAMGGIVAGLTLHRVKASMKHGTFNKWFESISQKGTAGSFLSVSKRHAQNYMRLALEFLADYEVQLPELLQLPGDQLTLDLADGHDHNDLLVKLRKFTGSHSLNELLIKHDIKAVGLKKQLRAAKDDEDDEPPAKTAQELCMEIIEALARLRDQACDQSIFNQMDRQQAGDLKFAFAEAAREMAAKHNEAWGAKPGAGKS